MVRSQTAYRPVVSPTNSPDDRFVPSINSCASTRLAVRFASPIEAIAIGDVFQNVPIQKFEILAGKGNLAPPRRGVGSVQRYPVNENISLIGLNKPTQKIEDRRFPGT
jgi:hypothetical protein